MRGKAGSVFYSTRIVASLADAVALFKNRLAIWPPAGKRMILFKSEPEIRNPAGGTDSPDLWKATKSSGPSVSLPLFSRDGRRVRARRTNPVILETAKRGRSSFLLKVMGPTGERGGFFQASSRHVKKPAGVHFRWKGIV